MNTKESGKLFLSVIIGIVGCGVGLSLFHEILSEFWMSIIQYAVIFLITIFFFFKSKNKGAEFFGFHKFNPQLIPFVILYGLMIIPITILIGGFFNQIFYNPLEASYGTLIDWKITISALIIAPILEEMLFRGAIFNGLKKDNKIQKAILISSLLFALYHCNITQFFYTFVCALFFAILAEASRCIWTSIIVHFMFNFAGIFGDSFIGYLYSNILDGKISLNTHTFMIISILIWLGVGVLLLFLSFKVLKKIKILSGKMDSQISNKENVCYNKRPLPSSMVSGIVICCIIIVINLVSNLF